MKAKTLLLLFLLAFLLASTGSSQILVDGTTCQLGDAIVAANTDTATGGCPAGRASDSMPSTKQAEW